MAAVSDSGFRNKAKEIYEERLKTEFEPARETLHRALQDLIATRFDPTQRLRISLEPGRVKQFGRLLRKAERKEYARSIRKPADLMTRIHDIVGTRVTCNVETDVYSVAGAICGIEKPTRGKKKARPSFRHRADLGPTDYVANPKPSGYRGYHVFVEVDVPVGGQQKAVVCEIQIRTLLQHAWGQLTHEDTYKPPTGVPQIVAALSKRLATALAVMDEIAQDIRNELDNVVSEATDAARTTAVPKAPALARGKTRTLPSVGKTQEAVGITVIAEVIYLGWDYALLQLPSGKTGILHWKRIKAPAGTTFVDVREYLPGVGEAVSVRIIKLEPGPVRDRIELELAGDS